MSDEVWEKYVRDPRRICTYGNKCYQKNPRHHTEFKHPPKDDKTNDAGPEPKKIKLAPDVAQKPKDCQAEKSKEIEETKHVEEHTKEENSTSSASLMKTGEMHPVPDDPQSLFRELFLVNMPQDFISFWDLCKTLKDAPQDAFQEVGLSLVGPYDVLSGSLPVMTENNAYLLNWRYYFDPPEFQTVLATKDKNGLHFGYYRDSPDESPCFVASGTNDSCKIRPMAGNIFGAVNDYLNTMKKKSPFKSVLCQKLQQKVKSWASTHEYDLDAVTKNMKRRNIKVVAKTFHEAGIVVPVDKKDIGYRPLIETDAEIKKKLKALSEAESTIERDKAISSLQEVITMANIATDECDFGTGLELGLDLFSFGHSALHVTAENLMKTAYSMLNRRAFAEIITVHLAKRQKGIDMGLHNL